MGDFILGVFAIYLLGFSTIGLINSVSPEVVTEAMMAEAVSICKGNEGLYYLELDVVYHDVYCNNGAVFADAIRSTKQ